MAIISATSSVGDPNGGALTREQLDQRTLYRRAVEAVIWGMPAVNYDRMLQSFIAAGGGANQIAYWSSLLDGLNQTLTPNPDTVYVNPFFDTREVGPMVLEIPPAGAGSITGSIDDCWQNALEDVGPAASTSYCRPTMMGACPTATFRSGPTPIRASQSCAQT